MWGKNLQSSAKTDTFAANFGVKVDYRIMKIRDFICIFSVFFVAILLTACGKEDSPVTPPDNNGGETPTETVISFTAAIDTVSAEAGSTEISLKANCAWNAFSDVAWLEVKPNAGKGDAMLTCSWQANPYPQPRKATIAVQAGDVRKTFSIWQAAYEMGTQPQIVGYRGVIGNKMKDEDSYFEITFDQPVTVESWQMERYQVEFKPTYLEGNTVVRQHFPPAMMGFDLALKAKVSNKEGSSFTLNATIPFYDKRLTTEGEIRYVLPSEDERSAWVSLSRPNKLIRLSLDDGHVMHDIDLPFAPGHICYNHYNRKIYVVPSNADYNLGYSNRLCMIDPQQGRIEETITFEPSEDAHPDYPAIYPYELQFTNDGLGIVLLCEQGASGLEWRYIDSANKNKQTPSGYSNTEMVLEHVYRSHDGQKIWANSFCRSYMPIYSISREAPTPKAYQLESKFRSDYYYAGGNIMDMQFSRLANKVFISTAPACECVIDLDTDTYSEVFPAESRNSKAAWDYSSSQRSWVYQVCALDRHFLLLDMDKSGAVFYCDHIWYDTPCNIYHLATPDQVLVATMDGIYLLDASRMKE